MEEGREATKVEKRLFLDAKRLNLLAAVGPQPQQHYFMLSMTSSSSSSSSSVGLFKGRWSFDSFMEEVGRIAGKTGPSLKELGTTATFSRRTNEKSWDNSMD